MEAAALAVVEPEGAEQAAVEPEAVEQVVAALAVGEPEAPVGPKAGVAEASIDRSSKSPIAPKRRRTISRYALPAWSGAPRSTGACSATAAFFLTPK